MSKRPKGGCVFCGREMTKGGLLKHLRACEKRSARSEERVASAEPEALYHLRVEALDGPGFWLDLEVRGSASLIELDHYLRRIWLECCGHMSRFSEDGWGSEEMDKGGLISAVFGAGLTELIHIYDFGSSSKTKIKKAGLRQGAPLSKHPIFLMSRNNPLDEPCQECDAPSTWLCMECVCEREESGALCDKHNEEHSCEEYGGTMPFVNSPRVGMCGYGGPAEPPY